MKQYFKTKYGTLIDENNVTITQEDGNELFEIFKIWQKADGTILDSLFVSQEDSLNVEIPKLDVPPEILEAYLTIKNTYNL